MRTTMRNLLYCGLAPLAVSCSTKESFKTADIDDDNAVTFTEFDSYMKKTVFDEIDTNRDGKVTMDEWRSVNPNDPISEFHETDKNGDGFITRTEADAGFDREKTFQKLFEKLDSNRDGSLSRAEIDAFKAKMKQQPGKSDLEKLSQAASTE